MSKPNITSLTTPERIAAVPKHLRVRVPPPKGHHGLCVGRGDELAQIHAYFETQWRAEEQGTLTDDDCVACIITNAPGSGKTTMREQFGKEVMERDMAWIELRPGAMMTETVLADAIADYAGRDPGEGSPVDPEEGRTIRQRLRGRWAQLGARVRQHGPDAAGVGVGILVDSVTTLGIGSAAALRTKVTLERKNELATQLLNHIDSGAGMPSALEALQALSRTHAGRYMLTVDEAHEWGDPRTNYAGLQLNLDLICSPSVRRHHGIQGGGLLLSGLGDVKDHIDGLGLSRAEVIWVGELNDADGAAIVRHALAMLTPAELPEPRRTQVLDEWPPALAATFTGWPQHAATAGNTAKRMIQLGGEKEAGDDATLIDWIRTQAADRIVNLYADQLGKAEDDSHARAPMIIAALAEITGNHIPKGAMNKVVEFCLRDGGMPVNRASRKDMRGVLKRTGVLRERRQRQPDGTLVDEFAMGIPSLKDYIYQSKGEQEMRDAEAAAAEALATS